MTGVRYQEAVSEAAVRASRAGGAKSSEGVGADELRSRQIEASSAVLPTPQGNTELVGLIITDLGWG